MVAFSNPLRDTKRRSLAGHQMKAVIVKNDDSDHPDGIRGQRVQARENTLHANIKDEDLPWFSPKQLHSSNGGDGGAHGPIPPVGTVVHIEFRDDSQYHGQYMAGPVDDPRKIDDFTNKKSQYGKNYPHVGGGVDYSGSLHAKDIKTDDVESTHVSGTSHKIDGKGNVMHVVNGGADTKNKDASERFPKGGTVIVYGDATIWASGKVTINAKGDADVVVAGKARVSAGKDVTVVAGQNATVSAKQNATVTAGQDLTATAKGKATVASEGKMTVSSKSDVDVTAQGHLQLTGASITSSVEIFLGGGSSPAGAGSPAAPGKVQTGTPPKPRRRPDPKKPKDDSAGEAAGPDQPEAAQDAQADSSSEGTALDESAKSALRGRAEASLASQPDKDEVTMSTDLPSGGTYDYTVKRDT